MFVVDLMKNNLVTVLSNSSLADAAAMMLLLHLSGLLVLDNSGRLPGVVTEGDLLRRAELGTADEHANWLKVFLMPGSLATDYVKTHRRLVSEVMTTDLVCMMPQTELTVASSLMRKRHIKRLPVLEDGRPVGVISRSDMLGALASKLVQTAAVKQADATIYAHINASLAQECWAPKTGIRVAVKDAVVDLEGISMSDGERRAVIVIA